VECHTRIPRSRRLISVENDQRGDESSYFVIPLITPGGGIALSDSEKAEALANPLETQIQPVTDPLFPAVMEMVDVALWSYFLMPTSNSSERTLTRFRKPSDGYDGIPMNILKVSTPFITSPVTYKC